MDRVRLDKSSDFKTSGLYSQPLEALDRACNSLGDLKYHG